MSTVNREFWHSKSNILFSPCTVSPMLILYIFKLAVYYYFCRHSVIQHGMELAMVAVDMDAVVMVLIDPFSS